MINLHLYKCVFILLNLAIFTSCTISKVVHNDSVTQKVLSREGDTVVVRAGGIYEAGEYKRFMLGHHYRDAWLAPVKVPVINLDSAKGGLSILERGGGMQTASLKLQAKNGRLYSLRSIQKDPTGALPLALRFSFVDDLLQDQMSTAHPYGALIVPVLAEAAGIYHPNPELVYIPDVPALGKFRKDFGGMLAYLEEDADEDWSGYEDFGGTSNAVSTATVIEELTDDHDNAVDQRNLLAVRLFDMWINDWDRHDRQFRWATLEGEDGIIYRPIPEDRDNAFFKADGFIPWWISRKWAYRKFQDFQPEVRDIIGLNLSAKDLDRRFLSDLSREQWFETANDLKQRLTDDVISKAVKALPDTVYKLTGEEMAHILKSRRENLLKYAIEYYRVLAEDVDVVGSDKSEYFEVIRKPDGATKVVVYKTDDDEGEKERILFQRTFYNDETSEIRLYGLGGEDIFHVSGKSGRGPLLRILGGEGEDLFSDSSTVSGIRKHTIYYDYENEKNEIEREGSETKLILTDDVSNNTYDYDAYNFSYLGPALFFGYNDDDGVFFGGGVNFKTYGFKKEPFASRHRIVANFAPRSSAWNFFYKGEFTRVVGELGLDFEVQVRAPNYFTNFYGYGNESGNFFPQDEDLYRIRFEEYTFWPGLKTGIGKKASIKFGPAYHYAKVEEGQEWLFDFTTSPADIFEPAHFTGIAFEADVRTTEITNKPEKGIRWQADVQWMAELNNDNSKIGKVATSLSAYYTLDKPLETTFAVRVGGASVAGDFNFYQASTIGGNAGLARMGTVRGYPRDRFSGRSSLYQNYEIRMRLLRLPFYYMPFELGISGHFDIGRVWYDNYNSQEWHSGIGGGLWLSPLGRWVFTAVYTKGEKEGVYNLNLGFLF